MKYYIIIDDDDYNLVNLSFTIFLLLVLYLQQQQQEKKTEIHEKFKVYFGEKHSSKCKWNDREKKKPHNNN